MKDYIEKNIERIPESGCWIWMMYISKKGYGSCRFDGKIVKAHRLSYLLYRGEIKDGLHVCHRCDVRSCVNPHHLFLGTNKENSDDRDKKGRNINHRGEKHGNAKLTDSQVLSIRNDGRPQVLIAKEYNVSQALISLIILRKYWAHI